MYHKTAREAQIKGQQWNKRRTYQGIKKSKQNKQTTTIEKKKATLLKIEPGLLACQVICPDHRATEENIEDYIENIVSITFSL